MIKRKMMALSPTFLSLSKTTSFLTTTAGVKTNNYRYPIHFSLRYQKNPASTRFSNSNFRLGKPHFSSTYYRNRSLPKGSLSIRYLFTGIVEEMGEVQHLGPSKEGGFDLKISASVVLGGVKLGDSIAVNGTCLTVTQFDTSSFSVGLAPETLRKTSLEELVVGSPVNLERAVLPQTRMGGHFVQGHVDGTGEIVSMVTEGDSLWVKVRTPREILRFIIPKGFIAVDGTSLTVVGVYDEEECFDFMLVAYTQQKVVIPIKKVGDKVNLEVDILGKYVERLMKNYMSEGVDNLSSSLSSASL